ncbi:archaellin/type IV pilin N-terminal domain-containing protein [Methanolobus sp. ZRKC2]|uniref:archaellin/type IV pilin N-terminal domain-containing protein n=1 Tax=Methanolobus sp. ZRKC2 TaxID=3125783 RepID=UPI00324BDD15
MKRVKKSYVKSSDRAQIGIGTLIIFIAMVLVAAVAGAVLIQTSGVLQQKAQSTGKQATQETSSNIQIRDIEGIRAKSSASNLSASVDLLRINIGLNAASEPVDLGQVIVTITDGTNTNELVYANEDKAGVGAMTDYNASEDLTSHLRALTMRGSPNAPHFFIAEKVRDEDGSFTQGTPTINSGDLIDVYVSTTSTAGTAYDYLYLVDSTGGSGGAAPLKDSGMNILPRTEVRIIMTPEYGAVATCDMVMPSTYGSTENIKLYP